VSALARLRLGLALVAALVTTLAALALSLSLAACLPPDQSTERGAIYVKLEARPLKVRTGPYSVTFERLTMIVGADTVQCHSLFYVDRATGPVAVIDFTQPYTFEKRAITDGACVVVGGFILAKDEPFVAAGVSAEEAARVRPDGVGRLGNVHVRARVRYPDDDSGGTTPVAFDRVVDVLLEGVSGAQTTGYEIIVPHGDRADLTSTYDTTRLAQALIYVSYEDRDRDGVVTGTELRPDEMQSLVQAASDRWGPFQLGPSVRVDAGARRN